MKHLVDSVRSALEHKNWYAALSLALTLPDICGRLEDPKSHSQARYVRWCSTYLEPSYTSHMELREAPKVFLSGRDCYALRCAVLHEGQDDIVNQRAQEAVERFAFTAPVPGVFMHCNSIDNKLQIQVDRLCLDICKGVDAWLSEVPERQPEVREAIGRLMLLRGVGADGTVSV